MEITLPIFPDPPTNDLSSTIASEKIRLINFYILGPEGTNIALAAHTWADECGVNDKSRFFYCETPEDSVNSARTITDKSVFPIFVTCAVYNKLANLFFTNTDCNVLFHHYYMRLDNMQLAANCEVENIPENWVIASHPSPKFLVSKLKNRVVNANSNALAAKMCAEELVHACVTTETARKLYKLHTLHSFGSPTMLFLFGTTPHGLKLVSDYDAAKRPEPKIKETRFTNG